MKYREYCIHEGIAHCKTEQIMANDTRPGVKNILSWLYPMKKEFKADKSNPNSACSKEIRHDQQKDIGKKFTYKGSQLASAGQTKQHLPSI